MGRPEERHRTCLQPKRDAQAPLHGAVHTRLQLLYQRAFEPQQGFVGDQHPFEKNVVRHNGAGRRRPAGGPRAVPTDQRLPAALPGGPDQPRRQLHGRGRARLLHARVGRLPFQFEGVERRLFVPEPALGAPRVRGGP